MDSNFGVRQHRSHYLEGYSAIIMVRPRDFDKTWSYLACVVITRIAKRNQVSSEYFEVCWWQFWHQHHVIEKTWTLKPELRFCAGSNPVCRVSEIRDGEDLGQWSRLETRLNAFRHSTIPQKQFIIIITSGRIVIIFEKPCTFRHSKCHDPFLLRT